MNTRIIVLIAMPAGRIGPIRGGAVGHLRGLRYRPVRLRPVRGGAELPRRAGPGGRRFLGGGAEVRVGPAFLNASIDRFAKTGQRILVVDGEVFKLGIPETVTIVPVAVSAGWRIQRDRATPYIGAGVGRMFYKEQSAFADESERVDARFSSVHILGGIEFRNEWVATAFEVQYTRAPQTVGIGGALQAFHESNLGGLVGRVKVLVGR